MGQKIVVFTYIHTPNKYMPKIKRYLSCTKSLKPATKYMTCLCTGQNNKEDRETKKVYVLRDFFKLFLMEQNKMYHNIGKHYIIKYQQEKAFYFISPHNLQAPAQLNIMVKTKLGHDADCSLLSKSSSHITHCAESWNMI